MGEIKVTLDGGGVEENMARTQGTVCPYMAYLVKMIYIPLLFYTSLLNIFNISCYFLCHYTTFLIFLRYI